MKKKKLSQMIQLATMRHVPQYDRAGEPYILHPLEVMRILGSDDEELQCIAVGHDLFEDTFATVSDGVVCLRGLGFSARVIEGITALSRIPGDTEEQYRERVMANKDAVLVKIADLQHNLDVRRLAVLTDGDANRMRRYHEFYKKLMSMRG